MADVEELQTISKEDFHIALRELDVAVCEAKAVSNAIGHREVDKPHYAWATYIFLRICIHAGAMIANVPGTRWVKKDYELWDFSAVASHVRAIIEAKLLLYSLSKEPICDEEWDVKLIAMHLNDCVKRIDMYATAGDKEAHEFYIQQKAELESRLDANQYFLTLDTSLRKKILNGKIITLQSRDEILTEIGESIDNFRVNFDFLSHYTHVLPMSFYSLEVNGRGTGCYNYSDQKCIYIGMTLATESITFCTDLMCEKFPDVSKVRKGLKSKISIGPKPRK